MVTQEMLEAAMRKAVEVGLFPEYAPQDVYMHRWEGLRAVVEAAQQGVQRTCLNCGNTEDNHVGRGHHFVPNL